MSDEVNLYRLQGDAVVAWPKSGATPRELARGESLVSIAIDGDRLFFAGSQLSTVLTQGGAVRVLHDRPSEALAIGGGFVYFCEYVPGAPATIRRWSEQTGNERVAELHDHVACSHLVYENGFLYTMSLGSSPTRVSRVRVADGSEEFIADGLQVARGFVLARRALYISEENTQSIQRVSLDDGQRTTLATFAGYPWSIDSDGELIYTLVQYLHPTTKVYTAALVRLAIDGTGVCAVGSAASFGSVLIADDRVHWTGDCWRQGTR